MVRKYPDFCIPGIDRTWHLQSSHRCENQVPILGISPLRDVTSYWPKSRKNYLKQTDLRIWILGHVQHKHLALFMTENKEIHNRSALNLLCGKHRKHWHTHRPGTTHQAASVHTHCSWVLVAGCAVKHSAKVEVEVVTQGQAAEFTGVRAWQRRYSVSGSL